MYHPVALNPPSPAPPLPGLLSSAVMLDPLLPTLSSAHSREESTCKRTSEYISSARSFPSSDYGLPSSVTKPPDPDADNSKISAQVEAGSVPGQTHWTRLRQYRSAHTPPTAKDSSGSYDSVRIRRLKEMVLLSHFWRSVATPRYMGSGRLFGVLRYI